MLTRKFKEYALQNLKLKSFSNSKFEISKNENWNLRVEIIKFKVLQSCLYDQYHSTIKKSKLNLKDKTDSNWNFEILKQLKV